MSLTIPDVQSGWTVWQQIAGFYTAYATHPDQASANADAQTLQSTGAIVSVTPPGEAP